MTNREKLSKMAFIDILMYLHFCNPAHNFTVARCVQYCGDCYKCRMDWLDEPLTQPVKCGRWIWDSDAPYREHGAYKCSNCGCHSDFEENYCYNCGAEMDGDENENNS